jgi:hypothetical protein
MSDRKITRKRLPLVPDGTSRLSASTSQVYRLTFRPKPGSNAFRNLHAALRALRLRYDFDVIELKPIEDPRYRPRRGRAAVEQRQQRTRDTAYYRCFGTHSLPEGWPDFSKSVTP